MKFSFNAIKLGLKKHAPELLVGFGVAGMVGGTVLACIATKKVDPVVQEHKKRVEKAKTAPEEKQKKEVVKAYAKTAGELALLYGPAVVLEVASAGAIFGGVKIFKGRNMALAAAYATVNAGFRDYRKNVVEEYGKEVDERMLHGVKKEDIEIETLDNDGNIKKVKVKAADVVEPGMPSMYARYFAPGYSNASEGNEDYDGFYLRGQQAYLQRKLEAYGYLFLNDVYDALGYERTVAGQAVGWVYDRDSEDHGDNVINFADTAKIVYIKNSPAPGDYTKAFLLDFNVDGSILEHAFNKGMLEN